MKNILPKLILLLILAGCTGLDLSQALELTLEASPQEIVLEKANEYHQTVELKWKIINGSDKTLSAENYEFALMSARVGEASSIVLKKLDLNLDPQSQKEGVYSYIVDGIGIEGEYEFQWVVYEKNGSSMSEIKKVSVPYTLYWKNKPPLP